LFQLFITNKNKTLMRVKLSQLLIACATVVCLQACDSGNEVSPTVKEIQNVNGRLVFSSTDVAVKQLTALTNKEEGELMKWERLYDFESLRSTLDLEAVRQDTSLLLFPPQLATILNKEKEYQVEQTIIWFYQDYLFKVPSNDELLLSKIKSNPTSEEFIAYRETFFEREKVKSAVNGRVLPSSLATTTTFQLAGTLNYRFVRDLYVTSTGSNRLVELVNALQYQDASNGNWYLAGEIVNERAINNISINGGNGGSISLDNANGYLRRTIYSNSNSTPLSGTVTARFHHSIRSGSATYSFTGSVTWY
jgi:hypothetical protein